MAMMTQEITVDSATSIPPNIGMVKAVATFSSSIRNSDRLPIEPTPPCFHIFSVGAGFLYRSAITVLQR